MSQAWIGKARSLSLWTQIDIYVDSYVSIHQTSPDESWYLRWKELINFHKITKKKRDFEFIAYVITGNPEATVLDCLKYLFTFIPDLDKHFHITLTNQSNGNIQYTYSPPTNDTSNRFAAFLSDEHSDSQAEKELDDILDSDNTDTKHPASNSNIFGEALDNATSTLKKLSDFRESSSNESTNESRQHLDELETKYEQAIQTYTTKFSTTIDTISNDNERAIRHIHNEYYDTFCQKCDAYYFEQLERFEKQLQDSLSKYDLELNQRVDSFKKQCQKIEQSVHTVFSHNISNRNKSSNITSPTTPTPVTSRQKTPTKQFGATQSDRNTIPIQNYFNHNLKFEHEGDTYYLQDRDFLKNSPKIEKPMSVEDGLTIYSQLQKNALIYNIFISPIDKIVIWDMSPNTVPTTCNLDITDPHNFQQAYQRSAVAIYTKLQNTNMSNVPFFQQILEHERTSQDGYKVLYGILCICHPRLVEKSQQDPPTLQTNGSLFSFIRQYMNYIECERIANRTYSDIEQLSFVMNTLESDGRFDKALGHLRIQKNMFEEISKTTPNAKFPPSLTVEILPYTIMKSYSTEEKHTLFTDYQPSTPVVNALTNRYQSTPHTQLNVQRQRTNTICSCCGISGHDVKTNGCDFAASFLLTSSYLKNNQQMKRTIITKFKEYQKQRLTNFNKKGSLSTRIKKSAQDKRIGITPKIQLLIEAIGDTIEENTDSEDDIFDIGDLLDDDNTNSAEQFHDTDDQVHSTQE